MLVFLSLIVSILTIDQFINLIHTHILEAYISGTAKNLFMLWNVNNCFCLGCFLHMSISGELRARSRSIGIKISNCMSKKRYNLVHYPCLISDPPVLILHVLLRNEWTDNVSQDWSSYLPNPTYDDTRAPFTGSPSRMPKESHEEPYAVH